MPELPEVETIRRTLLPILKDVLIDKIVVHEPRLRRPVNTRTLRRWLQGQKIRDITRRAKYLIFHFQNKALLIVHLGMSGSLQLAKPDDPAEKHTQVIFQLSNDRELRYRDPRRFGLIEVVKPGQVERYEPFKNLGVEPLSEDFSPEYLRQTVAKSRRAIKTVLMDARVVVGIGNIYANEALFLAGIHPLIPAYNLEETALDSLMVSVRRVLRDAIEQGGTTLKDYRNGTGEIGHFQVHLRVYGREGEPCPECGTAIERMSIGGRSTFYCPRCQKIKWVQSKER